MRHVQNRSHLLTGHGLIGKGYPVGDAVCSCGERAGGLPTIRARQSWHRKHKEQLGFFWGRVAKTDGCWEWIGSLRNGYGLYVHGDLWTPAHRYSYEEANGPIPDGLVVDHLCRNTVCVRPDHLEAVTITENVLRGVGTGARNAVKTHCVSGHPFDDENTIRRSNGSRACRICTRRQQTDYKRRQRAKARGLAA